MIDGTIYFHDYHFQNLLLNTGVAIEVCFTSFRYNVFRSQGRSPTKHADQQQQISACVEDLYLFLHKTYVQL